MNIAIVGNTQTVHTREFKTHIHEFMKKHPVHRVFLFRGHKTFNSIVEQIVAPIPVERLFPPRPFWVGKCPLSYRKHIARSVCAQYIAQKVDTVLVFITSTPNTSTISFSALPQWGTCKIYTYIINSHNDIHTSPTGFANWDCPR